MYDSYSQCNQSPTLYVFCLLVADDKLEKEAEVPQHQLQTFSQCVMKLGIYNFHILHLTMNNINTRETTPAQGSLDQKLETKDDRLWKEPSTPCRQDPNREEVEVGPVNSTSHA